MATNYAKIFGTLKGADNREYNPLKVLVDILKESTGTHCFIRQLDTAHTIYTNTYWASTEGLLVMNLDDTNSMSVRWTDTNSNDNTQRLGPGGMFMLLGQDLTNANMILGLVSSSVSVAVAVLGSD